MSQSKPLTFGELAVGDQYISFPLDGDDSGHGGYRGTSYVFEKLTDLRAARLLDGIVSKNPASMPVLRVQVRPYSMVVADTVCIPWAAVARGRWMIVCAHIADVELVKPLRRILNVVEADNGDLFWHWEGQMHLFPVTQTPPDFTHASRIL